MTTSSDSAAAPAPEQHRDLPSRRVAQILDYLAHDLPGYSFDPDIDVPFVHELVADFVDLDILEQVKAFRWFHDNAPCARLRNPRLALRRWLARGWTR